jgi:aminoglycoside phosphotransferase (APT) family kinase protein
VTITGEAITTRQIESALRTGWPNALLSDEPQPITGGEWAKLFRLRVSGQPDGVPSDLVLRIAPQAEMAAKEQAVQLAAGRAGVSTPPIHLAGPAVGPLGCAWSVMEVAPGRPLLADLDAAGAVARLPAILRRLPGQLADTMATIHRVDPDPVVDAARAAAPTVALTLDELWPHLASGAGTVERPDLARAVDRLAAIRPVMTEAVLCHGDLHPLNLLADGDRITVLDWTGAVIAPPAFDVAFTALLLRHPPLVAPPALRPVVGTGAAVLARRFTRRYTRVNPIADLADLDWFTALHAVRILAEQTRWARVGDRRAEHHPWHLMAPAAARALARVTGIAVGHR